MWALLFTRKFFLRLLALAWVLCIAPSAVALASPENPAWTRPLFALFGAGHAVAAAVAWRSARNTKPIITEETND